VGVKGFYKKKKLLEIYGNYDIVKQKEKPHPLWERCSLSFDYADLCVL